MKTGFLKRIFAFFEEIWFLWLLALTLNIITFFFVYRKINHNASILPLHYNVLVGVEWYGNGANLYFIPGIGLAVILINLVAYRLLRHDPNFLSFLTAFVSLCVQIILMAAVLFLSTVS